jgi:hypothetical protein
VKIDGSDSIFSHKRRTTRKVIDSNQLQDGALRLFLSASTDNCAVLTDYAAMEAYKGDTLAWIYGRMEILAQYPRQVLILKSTQDICRLSGGAAILQAALIDEIQTRDFSEYCQDLLAAKYGDVSLQRQLLARNCCLSFVWWRERLASWRTRRHRPLPSEGRCQASLCGR